MSRFFASLAMILLFSASAFATAFVDRGTIARDFADGRRRMFTTKDHPKAKNAHFTIAYPSSWRAGEGDRPNIVQKFVSDGGRGLEMSTISTMDLPLPSGMTLSEGDQRDILSASDLKDMLRRARRSSPLSPPRSTECPPAFSNTGCGSSESA